MSWIKVCVRIISLSCFVSSVWTTVTETAQNYYCTEELHHVKFEYAIENPDCDQYWSAQEHSIGTFLRFTPECHSPCKELSVGRIVLTECVNITLSVICSRDYLTEHRVHFYGIIIPRSLHNPEKRNQIGIFLSIGLLVIIIACLLVARCAKQQQRLDEESFQQRFP